MKEEIAKILRKRIFELGISEYSLTHGKDKLFSQRPLDAILNKGTVKGKNYNVNNLLKLCKRLEIKELAFDFENNKVILKVK